MLTSDDLLRGLLRLLRQLSGAEAVSLFLAAAPESPGGAHLVHDGGPAVPELADEAQAKLLSSAGTELAPAGSSPSPRPLASRAPEGWLIRIPADARLVDRGPRRAGAPPPARRKTDRRNAAEGSPVLWVGVRFAADAAGAATGARLPDADAGAWRRALELGGVFAGYCQRVDTVLHDPVTELPGRADFQATLRREVGSAIDGKRPLALVLTNPDDFSLINERFGSDAGDAVVREIARRLQAALRRSDLVYRYGGVVFAVVLPDTTRADAVAVAEKLHGVLTEQGYLDGAVRLGFSFGLATLGSLGDGETRGDAAWELIRQSDRALNQAKLSSSGRVVAWRPGSEGEVVVHRDRLNGIFTADLTKDYRNMLLLWDTVEVMTVAADSAELARRAVDRLAATFRPDRAGLFRWLTDGGTGDPGPELVAGQGWRGASLDLGDAELALLERALLEDEMVEGRVPSEEEGGESDSAYAVPLMARGESLGCLYLAGRIEALRLDASDLIFLKAFAGPLAAALDRAELAARERRVKERESRRLRSELEELRRAARETQLVYRSAQMEALLDTARRVAPTDATVLVTGPSGTGKELVARTVHALSPRRDQPAVVVDCAAISASLIDSELFGHERGAYTGAAGRTVGRLAEAAGSTLILDEIGELPLEVQAKLLRFVQEKQVTPVGGTRPRAVDVRLVAVTNRDLEAEVAARRFRADLYYRLKVVYLEVPALADRPDDIPVLTDHFVRRFSARYGKSVRGLTPEAAELAVFHSWPGNVRELEHRVLQAVLLCEGEEIGPQDLELTGGGVPSELRAKARLETTAAILEAPDDGTGEDPTEDDRPAEQEDQAHQAGTQTMEFDLGQLEKRHIERVLESEEGSVTAAARRLGIRRNTLYQKIKKYGIERPGR